MKNCIQKYLKDIRYPIAIYLSMGLLLFTIMGMIFTVDRYYYLSHKYEIERLFFRLALVGLTIMFILFIYQLFRRKWRDAVFLLLVSIFSPLIILGTVWLLDELRDFLFQFSENISIFTN